MTQQLVRGVLSTARTVGTRLAESDLDDFQAFYADPVVMSTLSADGKPWPMRESAALFRRHMAHWEKHGFGTWIFRSPHDGAFMGRAGLRAVDVGSGPEVELFYGVDPELWGQGLATEIARGVIEAAFSDLPLEGLVGFTLPTNDASRRVMAKCGFVRDGEIEHAGLRHLLFRLARTDWVDSAAEAV